MNRTIILGLTTAVLNAITPAFAEPLLPQPLQPKIRTLPHTKDGIHLKNYGSVLAHLPQAFPLETNITEFPTLIKDPLQAEHILLKQGQKILVNSINAPANTTLGIYRKGKVLTNPDDNTNLSDNYEHLGTVTVLKTGSPGVVAISKLWSDARYGDFLLPPPIDSLCTELIQAKNALVGKIITQHSGDGMSTANAVVSVNIGSSAGAHPCQAFDVFAPNSNTIDSILNKKTKVGQIMILRTFKNISYAVVTKSTRPITRGDLFENQETP